jgi:hypothetical protein
MICRSPVESCHPVWPSGLCFQRDRHLSSPVESRPAGDLEPQHRGSLVRPRRSSCADEPRDDGCATGRLMSQ